jgi:hypothetical protein
MRNLVGAFGPIGRRRYRQRLLAWFRNLDGPELLPEAGKLSPYRPGRFGARKRGKIRRLKKRLLRLLR